jgi:hypothetical protein
MPKRYMPFFIHHRRNHLANDQALVLLLSTHTCAQPRGRVGGRENRNEEVFRGRVTRHEAHDLSNEIWYVCRPPRD